MVLIQFILGLVFGSFLNVLIFRYDPDKKFSLKTAGGRSRCLCCGKQLRWYELIPILSWIVQLGKCRGCGKRISLQYPIVELVSAAIFVYVPQAVFGLLRFNLGLLEVEPWWYILLSALWIIIFLMLLAAFFIDARHSVISNYLNLAIFISGVMWTVAGHFLSFGNVFSKGSFLGNYADLLTIPGDGFLGSFLFHHLLGMLVGAGFFLFVVLVTRGRGMGIGDVKLMAGLGLLFGYPDVLMVMMASFVLGTLYAIPLLVTRQKSMKSMLPFGPFIVLATFAVFFFGARLLGTYFAIIEKVSL